MVMFFLPASLFDDSYVSISQTLVQSHNFQSLVICPKFDWWLFNVSLSKIRLLSVMQRCALISMQCHNMSRLKHCLHNKRHTFTISFLLLHKIAYLYLELPTLTLIYYGQACPVLNSVASGVFQDSPGYQFVEVEFYENAFLGYD